MAPDRIRGDTTQPIVILDTSAVLLPFEHSVDLFGDLTRLLGSYHLIIPHAVINELQQLQKRGNGKTAQHAKAGLLLIKDHPVVSSDKPGDEGIIEAALNYHAYVVTNDKELRQRLRNKGCSVIYLRQKQYLTFDE